MKMGKIPLPPVNHFCLRPVSSPQEIGRPGVCRTVGLSHDPVHFRDRPIRMMNTSKKAIFINILILSFMYRFGICLISYHCSLSPPLHTPPWNPGPKPESLMNPTTILPNLEGWARESELMPHWFVLLHLIKDYRICACRTVMMKRTVPGRELFCHRRTDLDYGIHLEV